MYPGEQGRTQTNSTVKENKEAVSKPTDEYEAYEDTLTYEDLKGINDVTLEINAKQFYGDAGNGKFKNGNILHNYNSYNYIFTLASLTTDQLKNPQQYYSVGGGGFNDGTNAGLETRDNYIVLRSGGYKRSGAVSSQQFTKEYFNEFGEFDEGVTTQDIEETFGSKEGGLTGYSGFKKGKHKDKDLFIDNVNFNCTMDLGANGNSNLTTGSFEVTEPYGVGGFYEELYNASVFAGHQHYLGAPFLLTLQFVGHRFEGDKLVTEVVPRATRYFPIALQNSTMSVTEAGSSYNVSFFGLNAIPNQTVMTKLPANIAGPKQIKPTVASVLLHLFREVNDTLEDIRKEEEDSKDKEKKIEENTKASKDRIQKVTDIKGADSVKPYQRNRYMLWFPKNYGTAKSAGPENDFTISSSGTPMTNVSKEGSNITTFEAVLSGLSGGAYTSWEQNTKAFLTAEKRDRGQNTKDFAGANDSLIVSNHIGKSGMQSGEEQSYTGFYAVNTLDQEVEKADGEIKEQQKIIDGFRDEMQKAKTKATDARKNFEVKAKQYFKFSREDLKNLFPEQEDEDKGAPEIKQTLTYNDFNELDPDDEDKSGNTKIKPNVDETKVADLNKLRQEWMTQIDLANKAKKKFEDAVKVLEGLSKKKGEIYEKKYVRYGKGAESWQFKKDTRLDDNIHKVIFDSMYATELDGDKLAAEYEATGYIPWYRIEKIAHLRGFDTYRNTEVYDFHYIIQPFKVHYSSMPLPSDVYLYDVLKQLAVREYNYIYTGKNLDVLKFDLEFNNLFVATATYKKQQTAEGSQGTASKETTNIKPPSIKDIYAHSVKNMVGAKRTQQVDQASSTTQTSPRATNASDTAKMLHDALYSGVQEKSLVQAEIQIVGDPVYLLSSGITNRALIEADEVETDIGEINCFSREGDIIFRFGSAEDYPTWDELQGGQSAMLLDESIYSGAYKVTQVESSFSAGVFTQNLYTYRRPNQPNDYRETREQKIIRNAPTQDPKHAPSSPENLEKMKKAPKKKLSKEDLDNLNYHGPGALGGITQQAQVEIPSEVLGLDPGAFGGSVFASVSQATQVSKQLAAGTFDPSKFTPDTVQKAVETGKAVSSKVVAGSEVVTTGGSGVGRQDIGQ